MEESKAKRLIVAGTVGAVLLIFILLVVMVYQIIAISVKKNELAEYQAAIAHYERLIQDGEDTLEARSTKAWIARRARELGYIYKDDVKLD